MKELFSSVLPLLFLISLGYIFRRINYFGDEVIQKLLKFVGEILVPCVIFNTILNLDIRTEHIFLSLGFFLLLAVLLLLSYFIYRVFHIKRKFFIFNNCAFAFGLMGIPLFSTTFGAENMEYLVAMGVGHELFFAVIYVTAARIVFRGDSFNGKTIAKSLTSPLFCMVALALVLKFSGLKARLECMLFGGQLLTTIKMMASVTTVLTMIIVGYRIRFEDKKRLGESTVYVLVRYALAFGVGYLIKDLVLDRFVTASPYFDYAFFTMLSQFGSTVMLTLVGGHCSKEDMEVACNSFVINVLVGIVLYVVFVYCIGLRI